MYSYIQPGYSTQLCVFSSSSSCTESELGALPGYGECAPAQSECRDNRVTV